MRILLPAVAAVLVAISAWADAEAPAPDGSAAVEQIVIDVEIAGKGATSKRVLPMPNAAGKLFKRYLAIADAQCPITIMKSPDKSKDCAWMVGRDKRSRMLVFLTSNITDQPKELRFRLSSGASLTPLYRRVFSRNRGRNWQRIAFEPPHFNDTIYANASTQGVIEIPPYSVQAVFVRVICQ